MLKTTAAKPAVLVQPEGKFELLPAFRIWQDEKQPRKSFDQSAMDELVESIKSNGIIQPLVVRYNGEILAPKQKKGPQYRIVCGERRYRAAEIAGMEYIPVVIRELDDTQALEIQIIENLQRQDVHPMDEARAFSKLVDHSKIEDIALRIGKSPQYVAQRIKLMNLLPVFQDLLMANQLSLSNAGKICRFGEETQTVIAQQLVPKDWQKKKDFQGLNDYRLKNMLDEQEHDLSKAIFKANDPDLYPQAGPCNKCSFNSSANKLLFPELEKKRICHNAVCFGVKTTKAYQKSIEAALATPELVYVSCVSYPDAEEKQKIKAAEEMGAVILNNDLWEALREPQPPLPWEEHLKENDHWSDDEDFSAEEKKEAFDECLSEWNDQKQEYEVDLKEYQAAISNGRTLKAFVINGGYRSKDGEVINVILKPKKGASTAVDSNAPQNIQQAQRESEIAAIEEREARNKELDREKVYVRSMTEMKELFTGIQDDLHPEEYTALAVLIVDSSYDTRKFSNEKFGIESDYSRLELFKSLQQDGESKNRFLMQMIRIALFDRLVNQNETDFGKNGKAAAMMAIAKVWMPERVEIFEAEQQAKAEKRIINTQKRIVSLQTTK